MIMIRSLFQLKGPNHSLMQLLNHHHGCSADNGESFLTPEKVSLQGVCLSQFIVCIGLDGLFYVLHQSSINDVCSVGMCWEPSSDCWLLRQTFSSMAPSVATENPSDCPKQSGDSVDPPFFSRGNQPTPHHTYFSLLSQSYVVIVDYNHTCIFDFVCVHHVLFAYCHRP